MSSETPEANQVKKCGLGSKLREYGSFLNIIFAVFCVIYIYHFWKSVQPYWFHPGWTTDDALQQVYAFHEVYNPGIFAGDLITEVMVGYLAPLHYWICYAVTWLCGDPIMMGHWVMLLQVVLTSLFLFLAVKELSSTAPALISVAWLFHTRQIMQRMTAGLPRGWAAVVLVAFLYFLVKKQHKAILLTLLAGCLLHPPATMIAALCYGLYLLWGLLWEESRKANFKPLITLLLLSPFYIAITFYVVHRPAHIGQMVDFEQASAMPEFQRPHGRFPFLPLDPVDKELRMYSMQSFIGRFYNPDWCWKREGETVVRRAEPWYCKFSAPHKFWKSHLRTIVLTVLLALILIGLFRKRKVLPSELYIYLFSIFIVYFASRMLAFKLYVPNRHLQFPLAIFFIIAFCVGAWRTFYAKSEQGSYCDTSLKKAWGSCLALLLCGFLVVIGSGSGLYGDANFNYSSTKKGNVFMWLKKHSPQDALIAGHPTFINGVMLFAMRRGFITTETAHPFYPGYNEEVQRRLEIALRAHYAENLTELVKVVEPEGIAYVVFERKRFYPGALKAAEYYPPLDNLVKELSSRHYMDYAYRKLPKDVDMEAYPFMPFKDRFAAVVDIAKLKEYLKLESN